MQEIEAISKEKKKSTPGNYKKQNINIDDPRLLKLIESKIRFKLPIGGIHKPYISKSKKITVLHYKVLLGIQLLPTFAGNSGLHGGRPHIKNRPRPESGTVATTSTSTSFLAKPKRPSTIINLEWHKNKQIFVPYKHHAQALSSFGVEESNLLLLKL